MAINFLPNRMQSTAEFFDFTIVEPSGHSVVWMIEQDGIELEQYRNELFDLGLGIEGFPQFKLHAVNVPASAARDAVIALMDRLENLGFALAFPVWRHD